MTIGGDRMMIRLSPEDRSWVAEQAEDEGVEPHIFVRLLINRARRGRPLLIAQAAQQTATPLPPVVTQSEWPQPQTIAPTPELDDLIEARLSEEAQGLAIQPEEYSAAIPLRRVERVKYNPGRTGTGG